MSINNDVVILFDDTKKTLEIYVTPNFQKTKNISEKNNKIKEAEIFSVISCILSN